MTPEHPEFYVEETQALSFCGMGGASLPSGEVCAPHPSPCPGCTGVKPQVFQSRLYEPVIQEILYV